MNSVINASDQLTNSTMSSQTTPIDIKGLRDMAPPLGVRLAGEYKRSFAYKTLKDRLPVIVTRIIDNISRNKEEIIKEYGADSANELKVIIGYLSEIRSELMTNKPMKLLVLSNTDRDSDAAVWNKAIKAHQDQQSTPLTWFNSPWLLSECYMYRRIAQIVTLTQSLATFDVFRDQKRVNFVASAGILSNSVKYTLSLVDKKLNNSSESKNDLIKLLKLNLWGNRCDLSLTQGAAVNSGTDPMEQLAAYEEDLLIDNSAEVWEVLSQSRRTNDGVIVDFILDNAGYEFITDLCVAVFLTANNYADKIRFYVKSIPWFISDVTEADFKWTIESMKNSEDVNIRKLGEMCGNYLENNQWTIEIDAFWTGPFDFAEMKSQAPTLYAKLAQARLVIIKGDLNYRKLMGDINWDSTVDFKAALRGFEPSNIVSLRTIKADVISGLPVGKATELTEKQADWMTTGQYGLIQALIIKNNVN